jgi:hypothetical protein
MTSAEVTASVYQIWYAATSKWRKERMPRGRQHLPEDLIGCRFTAGLSNFFILSDPHGKLLADVQ